MTGIRTQPTPDECWVVSKHTQPRHGDYIRWVGYGPNFGIKDITG